MRRMIEIKPGTEGWAAWLAYHRGSKTELKMIACEHAVRPFYAWDEVPPERVDAQRVTPRANTPEVVVPPPAVDLRDHAIDGLIEAVLRRRSVLAGLAADDAQGKRVHGRKARKAAKVHETAVEAVRAGQAPCLEGLMDIGMVEAFDPFEVAEVADGKRVPEKLKPRIKLVNLRDDPIGQMAKRRQIETLQLEAARMWQALYDTAMIGGARGIDPTNMKVDGGRFTEPVSDAQRASIKRLLQIDRRLGDEGAQLVRRVLGDRMSVSKVAAMLGDTSEREQSYLGRRLRECLDTAIAAMGLVVEGKGRAAPRDQYAAMAAPLTEQDFRRGQAALRAAREAHLMDQKKLRRAR